MTMPTSSPAPRWQDRFAALQLTGGPAWLTEQRRVAADRFTGLGFPTARQESWKFTPLRTLADQSFAEPLNGRRETGAEFAFNSPIHLGFVDGRYRADLSSTAALPAGVRLQSLATVLATDPNSIADRLFQTSDRQPHALLALNTAMLSDGVVLDIDDGVTLDQPVILRFQGSGENVSWHPRLLIRVGAGSTATLVEEHDGRTGRYFSNPVAEVTVGPGATLHHYKLQDEGRDASHLSVTTVRLADQARYDGFILNLGASLARNEVLAILDGSGIDYRISGAYAIGGRQHSDITTLIDHRHPRCTSREVVKGVVSGEGRAVFQGKIIVRPDAQKTDGYQLNRALLLSDKAEIDSKPELEIYADDVKCSHGATVGELDDAQLFYLRARGIPLETARSLLIAAFLDEAIDEIAVTSVREHFSAVLHQRLTELGR
jgi:Fe-S cluster assembly protein SufD